MTEYEVFGYLSSRGQPTYDEELIPHAALEALDGRLLDAYLGRLQRFAPVPSSWTGRGKKSSPGCMLSPEMTRLYAQPWQGSSCSGNILRSFYPSS
jgi:hypothetical protein